MKVVDCKSFSKAAESVLLSQPTISSHVKDLEEHFGCRLINRLSKTAEPTKAGELLYSYGSSMTELETEAETAMADFLGLKKGTLTIGGSTMPGGYILPGIIGKFSIKYPDIKTRLLTFDSEEIIDMTLAGNIEAGVVGAKPNDKLLDSTFLMKDEMKLIVPAGHRWVGKKSITFEELRQEPFILREPGSGTLKSISASLLKRDYRIGDLKAVAEMGSSQSVIQGIKCSAGVSILSTLAVEDDLDAARLFALDIEGVELTRDFWLIVHSRRTLSPLCSAFTDFINSEIIQTGK